MKRMSTFSGSPSHGISAWAPKPNVSYSSMRLLDRCPRAWLLRYEPFLLPEKMTLWARSEGQLAPASTLVGTVVDHTITYGLRRWFTSGRQPRDLYPYAVSVLDGIVRQSLTWAENARAGTIPQKGEYQPIDAISHGDGWSKQRKAEVLDLVEVCLYNFETSAIPDTIELFPKAAWYLPPLDSCPWFRWNNVPVYARYDFAVHTPDETIIIDWKCGDPTKDTGVTEQLHLYAAYAMSMWQAEPEDIRLMPVWLQTGEIQVRRVSHIVLAAMEEKVRQRYDQICQRLAVTSGDGALTAFPIANEQKVCRGCTFRSCTGYSRPSIERTSPPPIPVNVITGR